MLLIVLVVLAGCDPTAYDDPTKRRINPGEKPPEIDFNVYINDANWIFEEIYTTDTINYYPFNWQENFRYIRNLITVDTTGTEDIYLIDMEVEPTSPDNIWSERLDRIVGFRVKIDSLMLGNVFSPLEIKKHGFMEIKVKNLLNSEITSVSIQELNFIIDMEYDRPKNELDVHYADDKIENDLDSILYPKVWDEELPEVQSAV